MNVDTVFTMEAELQLNALDRAIKYHELREGTPQEVVVTATLFASFIRGNA